MGTSTTQKLALRIDKKRAEASLTVAELAKSSGIPRVTLDRRLTGDKNLTVGELERLSQALNVKIESWFGGLL